MSARIITNGFEKLHHSLFRRIPDWQGDLALGVVFAAALELLKQLCATWKPPLSHGEHDKFLEVTFKIIVRFWHVFFSISLCLGKDYFWNPDLIWSYGDGRLRENLCSREIMADERLYYITMFGYYFHHTLTQFNDPKRSDFWVLFLHHIITLLLILGSYNSGYTSVGVILAMCHEPSDLMLGLAKFSKYLGMKYCADIFFALFFVSWLVFRLWLFPVKCILSTARFWKLFIHDMLPLTPPALHCSSLTVNCLWGLMVVLYTMQLYWGVLIMKVLIRKLTTGLMEDVRSDIERSDIDKLGPDMRDLGHDRRPAGGEKPKAD